LALGENTFQPDTKNLSSGGTFILTVETQYEKATQRIIIDP
jgi:hypothetical protein